MTDIKENKGSPTSRRSFITTSSLVSLTVWHKPIINSILLPAHAQMSCATDITTVEILGRWRFIDSSNQEFEIEFTNSSNLLFGAVGNPDTPATWERVNVQNSELEFGALVLDISPPRGPWFARISAESDCIASQITIYDLTTSGSSNTLPIIGERS